MFTVSSNNFKLRRGQAWADWRGWPYVLVGAAVLLRLAHIWNSHTNPTFWAPSVDPQWYDTAAQTLLTGHWEYPLFRAPLYPLLLGGVYNLFGHDLVAARILNVLLQAATVWVIFRVGRSYFSPLAGIISAGFFAVNGMAIFYSAELLPPSLEMLAAALVAWATMRLLRDSSPAAVVVCGLSWGIAAIIRPNFLLALPVPALAVYLSTRREWRMAMVWLVATLLPILPVTILNAVKGGELVLVATQGGVNLWIGNNPESTGILAELPGHGSTWTVQDARVDAERAMERPLKPGEVSDFYARKAQSFLLSHPGKAVQFMIRKTALFFNQFEISNNKHITHFASLSPWLPWLIKLNFGLLVPFALLGAWVHRRDHGVQMLWGMTLLLAASVILFFVTSRFRMPVVPWLTLAAAAGVSWVVDTLRQRMTLRRLSPLALLVPGLVLVNLNLWNLREAPIGWARSMEANAFLQLQQMDSARVAFEDAIRDSQLVDMAELNLGVMAYRQGKIDEALSHYRASLAANPDNVDALNNIGTVSELKGDTSGAIQAYRRAMEIKPYAGDPRHNLAGLYFREGVAFLKGGQDSMAAVVLKNSAELVETPSVRYNLAVALGRLGRNEEAIAQLNSALALDPTLTPARSLLSQYVKSEGGPQDPPLP